ncbi:MAG: 6-bladed beta-propeller [Parabacteroides sp.]|nr:6-bladed beta-propeller [Parabacteroides sp.]
MRETVLLSILILVGWTACTQKTRNTQSTSGTDSNIKQEQPIPALDVNEVYPQKEVVAQNLGNIRYIRLETQSKALLGDNMSPTISKDGFFFYGFSSGDIIGFDLDGKLLINFNHKGQGANEYTNIQKVAFDKENGEIFVLTQGKSPSILAYDTQGEPLYSYSIPDTLSAWNIVALNKKALLIWDIKNTPPLLNGTLAFTWKERPAPNPSPYVILDKKDGSIISRLPLSIKERFRHFIMTRVDGYSYVYIAQQNSLTPYMDGFILNEYTSDTTFWIDKDQTIKPIFTRTPSVRSDLLKGKLCEVLALTDSYACIRTISLNTEEAQPGVGLKEHILLLDRKAGNIAECIFRDENFKGKDGILPRPISSNNKLYFMLYPHVLKEAETKHSLSGELEKLTQSLKDDDNPVLIELSVD